MSEINDELQSLKADYVATRATCTERWLQVGEMRSDIKEIRNAVHDLDNRFTGLVVRVSIFTGAIVGVTMVLINWLVPKMFPIAAAAIK